MKILKHIKLLSVFILFYPQLNGNSTEINVKSTMGDLDLPSDIDTSSWSHAAKLSLSADRKYFKARDKIRLEYRKNFAEILKATTSIEVFNLDSRLAQPTEGGSDSEFEIVPCGKSVKILKKATLPSDKLSEIRDSVIDSLSNPDDQIGAWCHDPVHGVNFYINDQKIFSTSFCYKCNNYFIKYPDDDDGSASWVGIPAKNNLKEVFEKLLK